MTERQGSAMDVVEVLRDRLGMHYQAGHDAGKREIVSVIADVMGIGRDDAEAELQRQIDGGRIRYITRAEHDRDYDVEAQHDEHTDREVRREAEGYTDRSENLRINAIPGQGGPGAATSGITGPAAAPVIAGGSSTPPAVPLAAGVDLTASAEDLQGGYWDFAGDRAGVVPSRSRKGQVEPRGT